MSDAQHGSNTRRRMPPRSHSNFAARTARDDRGQLDRRSSVHPSPNEETPLLSSGEAIHETHGEAPEDHHGQERDHGLDSMREWFSRAFHASRHKIRNRRNSVSAQEGVPDPLTGQIHEAKRPGADAVKPRPGAFPRPIGGTAKLGTFAGVFVPTTLNVLSILMFLRFGFILGQAGVVGMMGMLVACYAINLLTTMSISAIATNGTVRGGGAYYLISRSLGPEFGGSIGIVFYLGFVFNTSMNAVGLIDCFMENFGYDHGDWAQWLPEGFWWKYLWATAVLLLCTIICLAGSGLFARCSNGLLVILLLATFSIPFSALYVRPFESRREGIQFTGLSLDTFMENLMPRFTKGADGSQLKGRENFQDLFGILFPATGGIFAGASMSGDLKHPSKAIPKGTLYGLGLTFVSYTIVILAMGASITRASFYRNANVIQLTNVSGIVILLGEFATSAFSVLMGVIGSAKLLQALARDRLIPGLSIFGQGTAKSDDPTYAIFITYVIAQITMLSDINQIASFITMTYLMTFLVTNLACFLLDIGSAPNFRPSFHFFNWQTAAVGTIVSGATMFFVDGLSASGCVALLIIIFLIIHYTTPPKPWGDVSQSLIYHQVRKYLLRLRQEHVKFWRPQILLLVNDPRRQYKLIQFCNSLKKGALFVLGHVIVSQDFGAAVPEARRQQQSWTKYIDFSKIKAFVNVVISPGVEWGARNIVLNAGLGGMRPNIVVMGFYNLGELRQTKPLIDIPSPQPSRPQTRAGSHPLSLKAVKAAAKRRQSDQLDGTLPTDEMRAESSVDIQSYVTILEDLVLRLQINVALAKGFQDLDLPRAKPTKMQTAMEYLHLRHSEDEEQGKKYIDLWPIQMSAEISSAGDNPTRKNVLTTNFDTYTLILQLGCILNTVPSWKRTYRLRVAVFVEYESDVEEERGRVTTLLRNLRIEAEVLVFWLASGELKMYEVIVNGSVSTDCMQAAMDVDDALEDEEWWQEIQQLRHPPNMSASQELVQATELLDAVSNWPMASFQHGRMEPRPKRFAQLRKMLQKKRRKSSIGDFAQLGLTLGMRTQRLPVDLLSESDSGLSSSEEEHGEEDDSEAIVTESGSFAASENDLSEYDLDASDDEAGPHTPVRRSKSLGAGMTIPFIGRKFNLGKEPRRDVGRDRCAMTDNVTPLRPHPDAASSDTALLSNLKAKTDTATTNPSSSSPSIKHPLQIRRQSLPKFTSATVPRTTVADQDGPGPSIMFTDTPSPNAARKPDPIASTVADIPADAGNAMESAGQTKQAESSEASPHFRPQAQARGYPQQQSIPLSFNDLPCRAQHLILNELIRQQSDETAVVFTTLPAPVEGTCTSQMESVKYISDLEVLCQGLPPMLLVHSNSMTVTMNL